MESYPSTKMQTVFSTALDDASELPDELIYLQFRDREAEFCFSTDDLCW